jgi:serine/threonine protein kinase/Tfp pilus assembly protein PilF
MPSTGDLVGPYRLVSPLGKGAMGEVWRARDERLDRYVALKVLPPESAGDLERRARQLREARAAAAIRHSNVVTLFDIVSHEGDDILVMELVEGRTLSETLRKEGAPTLEVALRWIVGVVDALVAAHACGILHRDIKAANIMVTTDGIKVLDFGLAKLRDDASPPASMREELPAISNSKIALDETMASSPNDVSLAETSAPPRSSSSSDVRPSNAEIESYKTQHGQLLGTPLYMAPEQIVGQLPNERSEVFSIGVLAYEILAGKPPYTATTMDQLFKQITADPPPPLEDVSSHPPRSLIEIVERALAKEPAERFASMREIHDALVAEQRRLFAPPPRRWPLIATLCVALLAGGISIYSWRTKRPPETEPALPGDDLVTRALAEYDTFYYDKSLSSLRAALAVAPDHPRANAYMILFGGASTADQAKAVATAERTMRSLPVTSRNRTLLTAASTLVEKGPRAARDVFTSHVTARDRELAFWAAEMDYRAGNYATARDEYKALLEDPSPLLRGRIYDHYSSVLLYADEPTEALRIGTLYRDAFPGEADAVGVYATTLAAAGRLDEAISAAEQAVALAEGEDTLAGLGKVLALAGQRDRAIELYRQSLSRAGASRRPIRRAALAMLQLTAGDIAGAKETTAPCLQGADAAARERGVCLFAAGIADSANTETIAQALDALDVSATAPQPAYGAPASLAMLVRARGQFFGGGCVIPVSPPSVPPPDTLLSSYDTPLDFYAAYHVPFFATYAVCERAAALAAQGDKQGARQTIEAVNRKAPGRSWLRNSIERLR